jgi:hypothetical protein
VRCSFWIDTKDRQAIQQKERLEKELLVSKNSMAKDNIRAVNEKLADYYYLRGDTNVGSIPYPLEPLLLFLPFPGLRPPCPSSLWPTPPPPSSLCVPLFSVVSHIVSALLGLR